MPDVRAELHSTRTQAACHQHVPRAVAPWGRGHGESQEERPSAFFGQLQDGSEAPVVLCSLCGSYSETGLRGSIANSVPCKGRMSKGAAHRASRFARGLHPKRKECIDGPWPGVPALQVLCGKDTNLEGETPDALIEAGLPAADACGFDDPVGPDGWPDEAECEAAPEFLSQGPAFDEPPEGPF